jgi:O-antigen ligase
MRRVSSETVAAVTLAVVAGLLVSIGLFMVAIALLVLAGAAVLLTRPVRALWAFLILLPFFMYPVNIGGFSIFIGLPAALAVSVVLAGSVHERTRGLVKLPVVSFSILAVLAACSALASSDSLQSISRVVYLVSFGIFAASVAYARSAELITPRDVVAPLLIGATFAGGALIAQFVIQFAVGTTTVYDQLESLFALFGGSRAANTSIKNWIVPQFGLVRAIFPFMAAPSAGQYMMVALVTGLLALRGGIADLDRRKMRIPLLIIAVALAVTLSRQAWVGALVALAIVSIQTRPIRLIGGIIVIACVAFIIPLPGTGETLGQYLLLSADTSSYSSSGRIVIWTAAIEHVAHDTAFGVGPGLYDTLTVGPAVYYAHNVVLDALVELGYLGGTAFIAFVVSLLVSMWRRSKDFVFPVLVAVVIANMFDDVLYFPRNGFMVAALVGLAGATVAAREPTTQTRTAEFNDLEVARLAEPVGV